MCNERKFVISLAKTGVQVQCYEGDNSYLVSYAFHNFNPPKSSPLNYNYDALMNYQVKRWGKFLGLLMRITKNLKVIKEGKLIYKRGES